MISIFFLKRLIFTCVSLSHTLVLQVKVKVASVGCRIMLIHTRVLVRDSLIRMGGRGGRVVRWCWVNFQCRGVLPISIRVGQGPTALGVFADVACLDICYLVYHCSFLTPSLWETARYRLKYCLKGPLSPKQPANQLIRICNICKRSAFHKNCLGKP